MDITNLGDYGILIVNNTTHNTKYCSGLGNFATEKMAITVCDKLNKQYAKRLAEYNCTYDYIQISSI